MSVVRPFADAHKLWREQGWQGTLILPAKKKDPPPTGMTGHEGRWPTALEVAKWARDREPYNLAIRLPKGVCGLDVDAWKEQGAASFDTLVDRSGPLPPTWTSTSRDDGVSGIRFYRIPEDAILKGAPMPGIEIVQYHHRYAIVQPSIHQATGCTYRLYNPDGEIVDTPPRPDELPELPPPVARGAARAPPGGWRTQRAKSPPARHGEAGAGHAR